VECIFLLLYFSPLPYVLRIIGFGFGDGFVVLGVSWKLSVVVVVVVVALLDQIRLRPECGIGET